MLDDRPGLLGRSTRTLITLVVLTGLRSSNKNCIYLPHPIRPCSSTPRLSEEPCNRQKLEMDSILGGRRCG